MAHGIQCYDSSGKLTLDTEYSSLPVLQGAYPYAFSTGNLSYTLTVPGFDNSKKGHCAVAIPRIGYAFAVNKVEYPALGQIKVTGLNGEGCVLLVLMA